MRKKKIKKFIPFQTSIKIDVKDTDFFKQKILINENNEILCCLVLIDITINNKKEKYYDVGAYRKIKENHYDKLNYGGLFKFREKAEDEYLKILKEVEFDLEYYLG
jgi:hypothetical protein